MRQSHVVSRVLGYKSRVYGRKCPHVIEVIASMPIAGTLSVLPPPLSTTSVQITEGTMASVVNGDFFLLHGVAALLREGAILPFPGVFER